LAFIFFAAMLLANIGIANACADAVAERAMKFHIHPLSQIVQVRQTLSAMPLADSAAARQPHAFR
jgi:hypothetical protein